ncbi:MAG: hypothetical protein AAFP13_11795 [Pseudomonadota bacterium]
MEKADDTPADPTDGTAQPAPAGAPPWLAARYGEEVLIPREGPAPPPPLRTRLATAAKVVTGALAAAPVVLFLVLLGIELRDQSVIIEPALVAEGDLGGGLTPETIAYRLWDELVSLQIRSQSRRDTLSRDQGGQLEIFGAQDGEFLSALLFDTEQVAFSEPVTGLSVAGVANEVRRILNAPRTRVVLEAHCRVETCSDALLSLRVRIIGRDLHATHVVTGIADAAEAVLREFQPYYLAAALLADAERWDEGYRLAQSLAVADTVDGAYAANLLGNAALPRSAEAAALWYRRAESYAEAAEMEAFTWPQLGLIRVHLRQGNVEEGARIYAALQSDFPDDARLHRHFGTSLLEGLGAPAGTSLLQGLDEGTESEVPRAQITEAIAALETALALAETDPITHINLAGAELLLLELDLGQGALSEGELAARADTIMRRFERANDLLPLEQSAMAAWAQGIEGLASLDALCAVSPQPLAHFRLTATFFDGLFDLLEPATRRIVACGADGSRAAPVGD